MSALTGHVSDYLAMRRALGYKLERAGQLLPQLVSYLEARGAPAITAELAIAWARLPEHATPNHWAQRLAVARSFAGYLKTIDPVAEVPPAGVFPSRRHRPAPYLWSEEEVCCLLRQAGTLRPRLRQPPTRRCSACWRPRACASARRSPWAAVMSTWTPA